LGRRFMNSFFSSLPADGWQRFLCDSLWQSTLIAAVGWFVARFFLRQATARSWVLLLTLTACLAVPLASLAARANGWGLLASEKIAAEKNPTDSLRAASELTITELPHDEAPTQSGDSSPPSRETAEAATAVAVDSAPTELNGDVTEITAAESLPGLTNRSEATAAILPNLLRWLGLAWLSASALLLMRLCLGIFATRRLLRSASACNSAALQTAAETAAQRLGLKTPVRLMLSKRIATPMILAFGKPVLLVPAAATQTGQAGQTCDWTAAFTHELAHVLRGDGWSRLWAELIAIALPCSPLVWLAKRDFRIACEEACDDWVLATGSDPAEFAETLTNWISSPAQPIPLAAIGMSSTKARMLRILSMKEKPMTRLRVTSRAAVVLGFLLMAAGLAVAQTKKSLDAKSGTAAKAPADTKPQAKSDPAKKPVARSTDELPPKDFVPPKEMLDALIADDSLVTVFDRRIEQAQKYLRDDLEAFRQAKTSENPPAKDENSIREGYDKDIQSLKERRAKRVAEITPRIIQRLWESRLVPRDTADDPQSKPYVIEPPDILLLEALKLVPKKPFQIAPNDKVKIQATGTRLDQPIDGTFQVDSAGEIVLGPGYGSVKLKGLDRREAEEAVTTQLQETLASPQVALTIDEARLRSGLSGEHLVGPDGTINLGAYGSQYVAGMTVAQAKDAIEKKLSKWFVAPIVSVDICAYNSKVYYVINEYGGSDENIQRFPITGNETVLDAISQIPGPKKLSSKDIWIVRPLRGKDQILKVRWNDIISGAGTNTNYQILPGDRVHIRGAEPKQDAKDSADASAARPEVKSPIPARDPSSSLAIKITGPETAKVGDDITFDVEIKNTSAATLEDLLVSDRFGEGLQQGRDTGPIRPGQVLKSLRPQETIRFALQFRATKSGELSHTVEITGPDGFHESSVASVKIKDEVGGNAPSKPDEKDSSKSSAAPPWNATVGSRIDIDPNATLSIDITGPETAKVGDDVTFSVEMKNTGFTTLEGLAVTDRFDRGLAHGTDISPIRPERQLGALKSGESKKVALKFRVTKAGKLSHTVEVTGPNGLDISKEAAVMVADDAPPPQSNPSKLEPTG
jgi:polysaccharide export outer membrane protein